MCIIIGRYLETGLPYLLSCPCPYPGFQPYRASAAPSLGQGRAFSSQLQCKCKVNLLYVQNATRFRSLSGMRPRGRLSRPWQMQWTKKCRASREQKWKVVVAMDKIRYTKNCEGLCRSGVHWLPGANELDHALRYFYLCLELPHAGSVARMPRRRQALIKATAIGELRIPYSPSPAPRILIPKFLLVAVLHLEIPRKANNAPLRLGRSKSLEFP
jgi:hypothetical protein